MVHDKNNERCQRNNHEYSFNTANGHVCDAVPCTCQQPAVEGKECDWCEGLGYRTVSVEQDNGYGAIEQEECEKCHGRVSPTKESPAVEGWDWEEEFDFKFEAGLAGETTRVKHFIASQITKAKEEERRVALTQAWQKMETDIRAETVQHAVEQAMAICRSLLPTGDNKQ